MAKLSKQEAKRKIINIEQEVPDYSTLEDLTNLYGPDAKVYSQSFGYHGCELMITLEREETDEEYETRTENILKVKKEIEQKNKEKRKKQKDQEYQTYLKLKEKFEGKE